MVELLEANLSSDDMDQAIQDYAAGVINKHLQYMTLNGADPATDKNWTRKAEPADWFRERIGNRVASIQKAPRLQQDLQRTVDYGVQQYGRYFALDVLLRQKESGMDLQSVVEGMFQRFQARLKPEDLREVFGDQEPAFQQDLLRQLTELQDDVAWEQEHKALD